MEFEKEFDFFLSHNSEDKETVERLGIVLGERGYMSFLDKNLIVAGDDLTEELIDGLSRSRCTLLFLGPSGMGPWQNAEVFLAMFLKKVAGMAIVAILLDGAREAEIAAESRRRYLDLRGVFSKRGVHNQSKFEAFLAELGGKIDALRQHDGAGAVHGAPAMGSVLLNASRGATRPEPDLLPILCDRSEQVHDVRRNAPASSNRPTVFLIESDDRQSPESFCDRLQEFTLPKLLNLEAGPQSIDLICLELARRFRSPERFRERLAGDLAERLDLDGAEPEAMAREMSTRGDVSLVQVFFRSSEWADEGEARLRELLGWWDGFPELQAGKRLLVIVYVEYADGDRDARAAMRAHLDGLAREGATGRHRTLPLHRLYAIEGAQKRNFEEWARLEEVRSAYRIPKLRTRVRRLFDELCPPGQRVLPLEDAEEALYDLLTESEPS